MRPAPSNSGANVERNDRRVFINRGTMETMSVFQGSVVLIRRHDPDRVAAAVPGDGEDDSQCPTDEKDGTVEPSTVGVAWPMDRIEPNGLATI